MIVKGGTKTGSFVWHLFVRNWWLIILILLVAIFIGEMYSRLPVFGTTVFSSNAAAMLATVVGIFLVFRFNNAYERWWEARTLWGGILNSSRNWGREVTTLLVAGRVPSLDETQAKAAHRRLIYRHLAYINALRLTLRGQELGDELTPFLDADEAAAVHKAANPAAWLLQRQGVDLDGTLGADTANTLIATSLQSTLNELSDDQGGCERINNTAFPDSVTYMSRVLVIFLAILIPVVFLEPNDIVYPLEFAAILFIALAFVLVYQMAYELMQPFENEPNDTPMTSICVSIERDLRQFLGEDDLPESLQPVEGVLM